MVFLRQCPDNKTLYEVPRRAHNQVISASVFLSLECRPDKYRSDRSFQVLNSQVFVCRSQVCTTCFRHWSVIGRMHVIDLQYIVRHKRLDVTILVSTRIARTLSYADEMELAAADVTTIVGNVAALATDLFAKDGSGGSRRNRTHPCRARTRCSICEIYEQLGPLYFRRAYRMKFSST